MSDERTAFPAIGKVSAEFFTKHIFPALGARREDVIVGPRHGLDCGVIRIGGGRVLVATTDPIYVVPQYGWERAAWFAWHILASDITTSGFPPAFIIADWNLPMSIDEEAFGTICEVWHRESERYGAAIIAGHTARYPGTDYPMVGGAAFIAVGPEDAYLTPGMARPGDAVLITKGAAIEATGIFARTFPRAIERALGEEILAEGQALFDRMSTVEDALTAAGVGVREAGVTGLHDATECGVIGGVWEIAAASGAGIEVDLDAVPISRAAAAIGREFGMEPLVSISEGTLVATVRPDRAGAVEGALRAKGIEAVRIGTMLAAGEGRWALRGGQRNPLEHPQVDPFWSAFGRAMEAGLD
ncbi:MAG: AIR synthase family protein [Planctomycetes bacterium]|nr:AIR synthase family protein [Planctomycetota bacterium]